MSILTAGIENNFRAAFSQTFHIRDNLRSRGADFWKSVNAQCTVKVNRDKLRSCYCSPPPKVSAQQSAGSP